MTRLSCHPSKGREGLHDELRRGPGAGRDAQLAAAGEQRCPAPAFRNVTRRCALDSQSKDTNAVNAWKRYVARRHRKSRERSEAERARQKALAGPPGWTWRVVPS